MACSILYDTQSMIINTWDIHPVVFENWYFLSFLVKKHADFYTRNTVKAREIVNWNVNWAYWKDKIHAGAYEGGGGNPPPYTNALIRPWIHATSLVRLCNLVAPLNLILRSSMVKAKELSLCHKLKFSNPYILYSNFML